MTRVNPGSSELLRETDPRWRDFVRRLPPPGRGQPLINLTGMKFGHWTVLALHPKRVRFSSCIEALWLCSCDCGVERLVLGSNLRNGKSKSCGCLSRETTRKRSTKHGHARRGKQSRIYNRWQNMRRRCYDPNNISYPYYGARGITVCERWHSFANFFADMGNPPRGKSLDRINVNGNYEPGNCRWASIFEQARNKRPVRTTSYNDNDGNEERDAA
jgi:hypothetical protein